MALDGNYFLSCDWGTSSFRLYLVDRSSGEPLGEVICPEGIAHTHRQWQLQPSAPRTDFYLEAIQRQLRSLSAESSFSLEGLPIIISGMASASIGICELPYAELPFPLTGAGFITRKIAATKVFKHDVLLISGVKSDANVMRGEETQLLGLASAFPDDATFIFPGTHSKHIHVRGGAITAFDTYMTGELFQLLSEQSILAASVERSPAESMRRKDQEAFQMGVHRAETSGLLQAAFSVRTNYLFGKMDKTANFYYLSGLLIGTELKQLLQADLAGAGGPDSRILILCGGQQFSDLYSQALTKMGASARVRRVAPGQAEQAALRGHLRLLHLL